MSDDIDDSNSNFLSSSDDLADDDVADSETLDLSFPLEPDPDESGTRDEIAENIYQHEASDFIIVLRQSHAVHGKWSDGQKDLLASLLVYRLELHSQSPKQDRRFKHVSVKMQFQRDPPLNPSDDPVVKCFEPAQGVVITQLPTEVSSTRENTLESMVGVSAGVSPVNINSAIHYKKGNSSAWKKDVRVRISGVATKSPSRSHAAADGKEEDIVTERLGDDRIAWSIQENPLAHEIPDSYGLAVLLQRRDDARFRILFKIKATVDFRYELTNIYDTFYGRQRKSRRYDPSVQRGSIPEGLSADNLGALVEGLALSRLSFNHLPEEVKPVQIYKAVEGP
jgi:hypothetical protein